MKRQNITKWLFPLMGITLVLLIPAPVLAATTDAPTFIESGFGTVNDLIFLSLRLVGIGFTALAVYHLAIGIYHQDATHRVQSLTGIVSGLMMLFAKELIGLIAPGAV